jgi:hypothetical protein
LFAFSHNARAGLTTLVTQPNTNRWASLDVFALSIIAAVLQIQQFAEFVVAGICGTVDSVLQQGAGGAFLGGVLNGDNTCFDLVANVRAASAIVVVASFGLDVLYYLVYSYADHAVKARRRRALLDTDFDDGK